MIPINLLLKVSGITPIDATISFTTDAETICSDYSWALSMGEDSLTTETGTYTVEVSNDNTTWKTYKSTAENVSVIDALDDTHLPWVYFRVVYLPNGETQGTVSPKLTLKR